MKYPVLIALSLIFFSCKKDNGSTPDEEVTIPVVKADSTYGVIFEEDVEYGQGLSHTSLNSATYSNFPLKLDVYKPDNTIEKRPVFMFVHGGGFSGGSKQQASIITMANYYASRGWVFISIDYRLLNDLGTVPQAWVDYSAFVPAPQVGQFLAMYPAHRDAKAALRWIVANAETYNIDTDYITVGGGSAGAIISVTLGVSEPGDYRDELDSSLDSTISGTNLDESYDIKTIIDFWGSDVGLDALEGVYGHQHFDSNDPALLIAHGTADPTVLFTEAEDLKAIYDSTGAPLAYYPLTGAGHGAWSATVNGKGLEELSFDFIVEQQGLVVE